MDHDNTDHQHDADPTQAENPGAQGDFGAGQGEPGESESIADADSNDRNSTDDPTVGRDGDRVEGTEQPRIDDVDGGGEI